MFSRVGSNASIKRWDSGGPTLHPKHKLNISSFPLTLPQFLDCFICARNSMPIVLLLYMMVMGLGWGLIYIRVCLGGEVNLEEELLEICNKISHGDVPDIWL